MGSSINSVTLMGGVTQDIELRRTPGGAAVAEISLATSSSYKDKQDQWQETTEYHSIQVWVGARTKI